MRYIKQMTLTKAEARELEERNFKLEHVAMHLDGKDTYEVYVKNEKEEN